MGLSTSDVCRITSWIYVTILLIVTWVTPTHACTDKHIYVKSNKTILHNPQKELTKCGRRGKASWICDPNKFLCDKEGNELDELIKTMRRETGCPCSSCASGHEGYKFAIALVPKVLDGGESDAVKEQIGQEWTQYYRSLTNFGHCGEDVVVVWSVADHVVWLLVGDLVKEKYLYTKCTHDIVHQTDSFLCAVDPYKGLLYILSEIRDVFNGIRCNFLDVTWIKFVLPLCVAIFLYIITLVIYAFYVWKEKQLKIQRRRDGLA